MSLLFFIWSVFRISKVINGFCFQDCVERALLIVASLIGYIVFEFRGFLEFLQLLMDCPFQEYDERGPYIVVQFLGVCFFRCFFFGLGGFLELSQLMTDIFVPRLGRRGFTYCCSV